MPATFDRPEIPSSFGGLETDDLAEPGMPANALQLREIARNVNYAISRVDTVFGTSWSWRDDNLSTADGAAAVNAQAALSVPTLVEWSLLLPHAILCPKMPGHNRLNVHLSIRANTLLFGGKIRFALDDPFAPGAPPTGNDDPRVITVDDPSQASYSLRGLRAPEAPFVPINFWIRGDPGQIRTVHPIEGYDGDDTILIGTDVALPQNAAGNSAVKIASFREFAGSRRASWGPWWLAERKVRPDGGDGWALVVDAPNGISPQAKQQGALAVVYRMPRFRPGTIIIESWREPE